MTSVLSQEEIDELLSAIQIGDDYIDPIPRFYKRQIGRASCRERV